MNNLFNLTYNFTQIITVLTKLDVHVLIVPYKVDDYIITAPYYTLPKESPDKTPHLLLDPNRIPFLLDPRIEVEYLTINRPAKGSPPLQPATATKRIPLPDALLQFVEEWVEYQYPDSKMGSHGTVIITTTNETATIEHTETYTIYQHQKAKLSTYKSRPAGYTKANNPSI